MPRAASTAKKTKSPRATATLRPPSIISAMDDPRLFAPFFRGPSWDGWRTVLKAAYGLPLSEPEISFFKSVAGDRAPPASRVRELWIPAGRRAGKDAATSLISAHTGALFNQQEKLRPGERALVLCLACDRVQARIILNYVRSYFTDIPLLAGMVTRETAEGFELNNGVDVAVGTNSFRAVRGRPILLAVLDELAYWRDENSAKPDEELYKAITPALATLDGMIVGISSPYRKAGLLYNKFKRHFGQDGDVLVIQASTRQLNPTIDQSIIDRAMAEDPAAARAEWMGEFRDDIGGWLPLEVIESSVDQGVAARPPHPALTYRSFTDASGGRGDSFTCAIAHDFQGIAVLDCVVEIPPPFNPMEAIAQVAAVLREYGVTETEGDAYAAGFNSEAFAACGITYRSTARDRSAIYTDALPLFTSGRVRLIDNRKMINQFAALERRTSSSGRDRVDHGPGGHDDLCNAAAGALVAAIVPSNRPQLYFA
ncbi:hypothetical protein [Bradyrhizobium sp.]|uniref:hypothetical protein n=1 Tax=Bradyrhizobium sp. TaxID=376 RepID=UPI00262F2A78|nr:hypothetical protein [Bradyrhizobium sp.]